MSSIRENLELIKKEKNDNPLLKPSSVVPNQQQVKIIQPEIIIDDKIGTIEIDEETKHENDPENIDIKEFWEQIIAYFPDEAIAGISDVNENSGDYAEKLNNVSWETFHKPSGFLELISEKLKNQPNGKILEIGSGFGNFVDYIEENHPVATVIPSDIIHLCQHPYFQELDGYTIPKSLVTEDFSIVYSNNVFSFLSENQRETYYHEIHGCLEKGGEFLLGINAITKTNQSQPIWKTIDSYGNFYNRFFNQFTFIPTEEQAFFKLKEAGFSEVQNVTPTEWKNGPYVLLRAIK